ncbi:Secretion system effector C (SseC) like family [Chlamydia serpentis]|uniref:Secretion system effector C (SseC) like family n=1 Tax=Chlamydia serpentis TaxID=1967782 RepID=A0A2R8FBX1_9CHLA|nr:type III secretion system translocon subunit SctE [Chlamydia serpentis]SPN73920.1 Secretion system effector C (SseC) like family [Chlamydia serpentis]
MTSGVSGNSSNPNPELAAHLAEVSQKAGALQGGHDTKNVSKQGAQAEAAAGGFEDLIQDAASQKTTKKESTSSTAKSAKGEKSEKSSEAKSTTSVSSANETATAQAVQSPNKLKQSNYSLPELPQPDTQTVNGIVLKKNMGALALLGLIMTLMANAAGASWKASFQAQNQAIQSQVEAAPAIGEAIKNQANAQASATEAQAKQSLISGIVNIVGFAISVGAGLFSAAKGATSALKSAAFAKETGATAAGTASKALGSATSSVQQTTATAAKSVSSAAGSMGSTAAKAASNLTDDMAAAASKTVSQAATGGGSAASSGLFGQFLNKPNWSEKVSRGMNVVKTQGGRVASFAGKALSSSMQMSQLMHGITAAVEGISGSITGTEVAHQQRLAGKFEAQAEVMKQMSSVYGQQAGQAGQLQEQAMQSFNSALQTLQNIADSQTQTSAAIFS